MSCLARCLIRFQGPGVRAGSSAALKPGVIPAAWVNVKMTSARRSRLATHPFAGSSLQPDSALLCPALHHQDLGAELRPA